MPQRHQKKNAQAGAQILSDDFVQQLQDKLDRQGLRHKDWARMAGLSQGRISQLFNEPTRLTLASVVLYADALQMRAALVAYESLKPVPPDVLLACWKRAGSPHTLAELFTGKGK